MAEDGDLLARKVARLALEQASMIQTLTITLARTQFAVLELSAGENKPAAEEVTKAHQELMQEADAFHGKLEQLLDQLRELVDG